jgi:hypothetical protein
MSDYFLGLDLGQVTDYTALAAVEATAIPDDDRGLRTYAVRHLQRWPLGTRYAEIAEDLRGLLTQPPQRQPPHDRPPLAWCPMAVDATGAGLPVLEMLRGADLPADLRGVVITSGHQESRDDTGLYHVPKKTLVATMQLLIQGHRLRIAPDLPLAEPLANELTTFRVRVTAAGNETFESWRERDHDDLVLAVALAAWLAERTPPSLRALPIFLGPTGLDVALGRIWPADLEPPQAWQRPREWDGFGRGNY